MSWLVVQHVRRGRESGDFHEVFESEYVAFAEAARVAKQLALDELENVEWDEDDPGYIMLTDVISLVEAGALEQALEVWEEYDRAVVPEESVSVVEA